MIIKGSSRAGAANLGVHLMRRDTNERVHVMEMRGVAAENLDQGLREMEAHGAGTRCKSPLYHANIDPRAGERMSPEQWNRAVDALEDKLGLTGQPRAVVQHVKEGREHVHVVWSRIDLENNRAISDSHNYRKHEEVSRELEREFGHERVQGAHVEREGKARPARTPSHAEMQQAERSGLDPKAVKAEITGIWQRTDSGKAFEGALSEAGYTLARGDKRDFIVIDRTGESHSLARRIDGVKAADVRARLADVDQAKLPDSGTAKRLAGDAERARQDAAKAIEAERQGDREARRQRAAEREQQAREQAEKREAAQKAREARKAPEKASEKAPEPPQAPKREPMTFEERAQAMSEDELRDEIKKLTPAPPRERHGLQGLIDDRETAEKAIEKAKGDLGSAKDDFTDVEKGFQKWCKQHPLRTKLHTKGIWKSKEYKAFQDRARTVDAVIKGHKATLERRPRRRLQTWTSCSTLPSS